MAGSIEDPDDIRRIADKGPEPFLALPDLEFGFFSFRYVGDKRVVAGGIPLLVSYQVDKEFYGDSRRIFPDIFFLVPHGPIGPVECFEGLSLFFPPFGRGQDGRPVDLLQLPAAVAGELRERTIEHREVPVRVADRKRLGGMFKERGELAVPVLALHEFFALLCQFVVLPAEFLVRCGKLFVRDVEGVVFPAHFLFCPVHEISQFFRCECNDQEGKNAEEYQAYRKEQGIVDAVDMFEAEDEEVLDKDNDEC